MKIRTLYILLSGLLMTGCHKVSVEFSYSPTAPKTGEKVTFTNQSQNGEDYTWDFGDNQTTSTKNTTHTYRKAGTYVVTLSEKKSKKTCRHAVTVTDSIVGIGVSSDEIHRYDSVTLKAQVWNPFSHEVTYRWILDKHTHLIDGGLDEDSIVVHFRHPTDYMQDYPMTVQIGLEVTMDDAVYNAEQAVTVYEKQTWSLLLRTTDGDWYQPVYPPYYDAVRRMDEANGSVSYTAAEGKTLLDGTETSLQATDRMEQKVYTGSAEGLTVSNLNGTNKVVLTTDSVGTMVLDSVHQRLFYTTIAGTFAMPLIYTPNNKTKEDAMKINDLTQITAIRTKE